MLYKYYICKKGGGGVAKRLHDYRGEGGVQNGLKKDYVINLQPLMVRWKWMHLNWGMIDFTWLEWSSEVRDT